MLVLGRDRRMQPEARGASFHCILAGNRCWTKTGSSAYVCPSEVYNVHLSAQTPAGKYPSWVIARNIRW